ncbi:MAG TPA: efflux RND transporter periplasmic adaptor subunit [Desulfobulbaceae bacterium]|nr:efflux RND transporter periplasmic adaptor subunit [Desulfobulbaceae bacterium]
MIQKALILIILLFCLGGCQNDNRKQTVKKERPPLTVEAIIVHKEPVPIWLEYTGKTQATKRVEIRARVAGTLEKVLFTEGDHVRQGQNLFAIEQTAYRAALDQALAGRELNRASLQLARADVARYLPLVAEDLAPRATLEQYQAKVAELQAKIKADEAAIREAKLNLSYTEITAPIAGVISRSYVDVGNIVGYGEKTLLTTIVADDPMYAYFNPPEEQFQIMRRYKSKDVLDARVRIPATRSLIKRGPYKGHIDFGDNKVDRMTGTISMRAVVENPKHDLLEGTFVYIDVFVSDKVPFFMIPPGAILEDQQGSFVYTVDKSNTTKRVNIKRGFEGRLYVQITSGLTDDAQIIISGLAKIKPGIKVAAKDMTAEKGVMALMKKQQMTSAE